MKLLNPEELEIQYGRLEQRLNQFLADRLHLGGMIAAVIGLIFLSGAAANHLDPPSQVQSGYLIFWLMRHGVGWALAASLLLLWLPERGRPLLLFATTTFLWIILARDTFPPAGGEWQFYLCQLLLPVQCLLAWVYLRASIQFSRTLGLTILFSFLFWLPVAVLAVWLHDHHFQFLASFARLKLGLFWISCVIFAIHHRKTDADVSIAFNPIHAGQGILWPYDLRCAGRDERKRLWWSGITKLYLAYVLLVVVLLVRPGDEGGWYIPASVPDYSLLFLTYVLGHVGGMNVISGLARVFGNEVRDATHFAFLSRTPAEYWRRISVYNYLFIIYFVKTPVLRLFKSDLISTFVAFFVFFLTHFGINFTLHALFLSNEYRANVDVMKFLGFFTVMYVSRRWWFVPRRLRRASLWGWVSILATLASFAAINLAVHEIYQALAGG